MTDITKIDYLKQWDSRWINILLGNSNKTVGNYGCTTTCLSMATQLMGHFLNPGQLAQIKKNYDYGGNMNWTTLDLPGISFRWREGDLFSKNPKFVDMNIVKAWLSEHQDRVCLLEVAGGTHWLFGLWWDIYNNDITAIDPMTGATCLAMKTYGPVVGASLFTAWDKTIHHGQQAWQVNHQRPIAPLYN
jgi:hypothetical protein